MLPTSKHFQLEQLAQGVYAAVLPDLMANISADANAGIVDLGDATLVFDTFMTPVAAADLCAAVEQLTGRPPDYVINSHYHYDHVRGSADEAAGQAVPPPFADWQFGFFLAMNFRFLYGRLSSHHPTAPPY